MLKNEIRFIFPIPLVCKVEDYYKTYLTNVISWEEFVALNIAICQEL